VKRGAEADVVASRVRWCAWFLMFLAATLGAWGGWMLYVLA
jgi:hypothetical protein